MKLILSCIFLSFATLASYAQGLQQPAIDDACSVLADLAIIAVRQKKPEALAVYSNAFRLLKAQYKVDKKYSDWFMKIDLDNMSTVGNWVITMNGKPERPSGRFVNLENQRQEDSIQHEILKRAHGIE